MKVGIGVFSSDIDIGLDDGRETEMVGEELSENAAVNGRPRRISSEIVRSLSVSPMFKTSSTRLGI